MADEKKPTDKSGGTPNDGLSLANFWSHPDPFVEAVWGLLFLLVILYIINAFISILTAGQTLSNSFVGKIIGFVKSILSSSFLGVILIILSIICITGIIYLYRKLLTLRAAEAKLLYPEIQTTPSYTNSHWQRILSYIESVSQNDWKLAIIEADIMLGELLDNMSLPGDSIGDKLKAVNRGDFTTIDDAWEAHKIRNSIAHEGQNFVLNQREARRIIELYRIVFEEFKII